jgi:lipopolysaccharide transport system ATP-binding protein
MNKTVLKVENLSKLYRLGEVGTGTISHDLNRWWARVRGKEDPYALIGQTNDRSQKAESDYVWALKDINFDVEQGEILGIIGRNGAGKSTLLKILSQITSPTTGTIKTKGRIASLLEVGTGMHPEMTARENIYLNGAILGMTKKEIDAKFDEIVDFSGCAMYVDTPLKRFSSGMRVRLGFAVAAFLEPEILIVDEVLAVGDAEFQKKAIGKMKDISSSGGRTVLFVSHNMASVKSLCTRGIVLENGTLAYDGTTDDAVSFYLNQGADQTNSRNFADTIRNDVFHLHRISLKKEGEQIGEAPLTESSAIELETELSILEHPERYHITYHLYNEMGEALFSFGSQGHAHLKTGKNKIVCTFPAGFFQAGQFFLSFFFVEDRKRSIFVERDIMSFTIIDGNRELGVYMGKEPGSIRPKFKWTVNSTV